MFLFIVYIILILRNNTLIVPTISYEDRYNTGVSDIIIKFDNGINSKKLNELFKKYDSEYYVYRINFKNKDIKLSCNNINNCLKQVYEEENNIFNIIYNASGFKIDSVSLIAYEDEITSFLDKNNLVYEIK